MNLEQHLTTWDGQSVSPLEKIYAGYGQHADFCAELLACLDKPALQTAATWLLKRHFEHGNALDNKDCAGVYRSLPALTSWQAKLHVLQCMSYMPITREILRPLEKFLRDNLTDSNKFVRAWTYNGFYELARQFPQYRTEVQQFFDMAMRDEAPSVKSRIRNIRKKGF